MGEQVDKMIAIADWIASREQTIAELMAERDRYREALKLIAEYGGRTVSATTAREALRTGCVGALSAERPCGKRRISVPATPKESGPTFSRERKIGRFRLALERESIGGRWISEVYVVWRGRGVVIGWGSAL